MSSEDFFGEVCEVSVETVNDETGELETYFATQNFLEENEKVIDFSFKNGVMLKIRGDDDGTRYHRALLVDVDHINKIQVYTDEEVAEQEKEEWIEENKED